MTPVKAFRFFFLAATAFSVLACAGQGRAEDSLNTAALTAPEPFAQDRIVILKQNGDRLNFNVELAVTSHQQAYGLMNRTEMPEDSGMLFVFNSAALRSFWMKDTLIPLDMLFLHPDGEIHHIHSNAKPHDLNGITSELPAKAVLELRGGIAGRMGIEEGDRVLHRLFRNLSAE